jgi:cytochrome o ubiquinol oxidase subunit 3
MNRSFEIHHQREPHPDMSVPDPHQDMFARNTLGFWVYLMTDCLIFACLFVTYAVLHNQTFGGRASNELFHLPLAFAETMVLLCSSVFCGFAILSSLSTKSEQNSLEIMRKKRHKVVGFLIASLFFGALFLAMELHEFAGFIKEGEVWTKSAFLSSYFALVGTHGLHVTLGSLWMIILMGQIYWYGITVFTFRRLVIFGMFWHFLDLVWIFIFTFVYLMGVL